MYLILGRPFLATRQTLIDVVVEEFIMRVKDVKLVVNIFNAMKYPKSIDDCFSANVIHEAIAEIQEKHHSSDPWRKFWFKMTQSKMMKNWLIW